MPPNVGVTTQKDALRCLGDPIQVQQSALNNGRERFVWFYTGTKASMVGATNQTKRVSLIFEADGKLLLIEDRQGTDAE
ncbi:hypothetical protein H6A60_06715 [Sutterella massiliensis]|uniref:Lipoprotein SmpA/OmlA domain-containing protein n=1 Tax=Sutterella massiliensis TaxID=1816689 RepID=A0ABS2DS53_9BURK|nr:hypothetical protein [Sutterella massiliensis]MBM6704174.1 hypothetical protein [Sutterella massiliensis]